ncbi:MAG TPA: DEAD/DEAH box helicase, partial [bacterium]|nr:DEAD/DEAH box helicase [bacterium]
MTLQQILNQLTTNPPRASRIAAWREFAAQPAQFAPFPNPVSPDLAAALRRRGITSLYSHQADAFTAVDQGQNIVVVTPTASGKTLCYNL